MSHFLTASQEFPFALFPFRNIPDHAADGGTAFDRERATGDFHRKYGTILAPVFAANRGGWLTVEVFADDLFGSFRLAASFTSINCRVSASKSSMASVSDSNRRRYFSSLS
jgi:hypothetical protein